MKYCIAIAQFISDKGHEDALLADVQVINRVLPVIPVIRVEPVIPVEPVEPVVEPVIEPVVEPVIEPVIEPVVEPVIEPVMEPTPDSELSIEPPVDITEISIPQSSSPYFLFGDVYADYDDKNL